MHREGRQDRPASPGRGAARGTQGVVRQSGLTSIAATVAVLSGLGLDMAVAGRFGAGRDSDAFVVRLPLSFLAMFIATANQAFVPAIATWLVRHPRAHAKRMVTQLLVVVLLGTSVLAAVLALIAHPLSALLAPGRDAASVALATCSADSGWSCSSGCSTAAWPRAHC